MQRFIILGHRRDHDVRLREVHDGVRLYLLLRENAICRFYEAISVACP